ncbi:hypothetical protein ABF87_07250 [Nitrosomonas sp. JL21]|nr:hypothetical protein [Nitrosomonas sp. JL21]
MLTVNKLAWRFYQEQSELASECYFYFSYSILIYNYLNFMINHNQKGLVYMIVALMYEHAGFMCE